MRILVFIFLLSVGASVAQTNRAAFTPYALYVNVTNKGEVFQQPVMVTRIDPDGVVIFSGLRGAKIPFAELPEPLYSTFWGDTNLAAHLAKMGELKLELEKARAQAKAAAAKAAAERARITKVVDRVEAGSVFLKGRVLQKLDEGFLVSSRDDFPKPKTSSTYDGIVFLETCPRISGLVDDESLLAWAYPIGEYSYTAVSGGRKTVRRMTLDKDVAVQQALVAAGLR